MAVNRGPDEQHESVAQLLDERARLLAIGYRMLGSRAEAEDAVQETYVRWYRLTADEQAGIRNPAAWLTTAMTRVCLNVLDSARHRRESYVGEWLPEPLAAGSPIARGSGAPADPADRAALADEVTMALMVVLDALTPGERVALVLHDVFGYPFDEIADMVGRSSQAVRKLASTARKHVEEERRRTSTPLQQRQVVESFVAACLTGDVATLVARLDPGAVATSDGGGRVRAALRPVVGADRVARFLVGAFRRSPDLTATLEDTGDETRLVLRSADGVAAVATFQVLDDRVRHVWVTLNPDKLSTWRDDDLDTDGS
ncbi:RNA polymerase sigma-70 factor (ECF subfamily) [Nocardioides cavernae]|uniref:RNA polymerase sigma-70 factor (ECF subfamily) n=1 Tax=Nocardioides cavernae TaxID=1921566 RepID=A0A7Y9H4R3_9ACTN|nr:RNA polymerase sigma factor SigJ [Nocardioides cavernae]NYE37909.1 RNA polymerase sigma-70 factor (ECF subfamily) [Nocardioides cavernae]